MANFQVVYNNLPAITEWHH